MRLPVTASITSISLLVAGSVTAAPFIPKISVPTSYKDALYGIQEVRENVDAAECGGWTDLSAAGVNGTTVSGDVPMPDISASLPGRRNSAPLGDAKSGLGVRGDFEFPDSAFGYSSACNVYEDRYVDDDLKRLGKSLKIHEDGSVELMTGDGTVDINPYDWCQRTDKATPKYCKRLFDAWRQASAIIPREDPASVCPCPEPNDGCPPRPPKRYCFDSSYTFECRGSSTTRTPVRSTFPDTPAQDTTCRTTWGAEFKNKMDECHAESYDAGDEGTRYRIIVDREGEHNALASSYYRHYADSFMVPGITVTAPGDHNTWQVRAECYEYYKENNSDESPFDPRTDITSGSDEQCEFIIATDDEQNPKRPEWQESDGHSQKETVKPDPSVVQEEPRPARVVPDPWVADPETNLTMIDMAVLRDRQQNFEDPTDITQILGSLLPTQQIGSKTTPKNARTDQFDDTGERDIAAFFEEQQRELLRITADPQTRLIMPARFLVGLADDDPLFQYVSHRVSRADGTVEITLKAGLEDIGNVLTSFQRIFVAPVQEVRIPILVPLASTTEIDARIADWKMWQQGEERQAAEEERSSRAMLADPLIEKLLQYRERADSVRLLRGSLARYLGSLFDSQQKIREYFADWYGDNSDLLLLSGQRAVERRELKRIWRLLQRSMLQTDACQMLWCSNQRYSAPVHSLLDGWWGENEPGEKRDLRYRPRSLTDLQYVQAQDQLYDFSNVRFPREPWLIPALWPVQVRLRLPTPPLIGAVPESAQTFPDLPPLPDETVFDSFPAPTVTLPEKSFITPPVPESLAPAKDVLRGFRKIIDGTEIVDQMSEENEIAAGGSIDGGDDNFPLDRGSMRGAYCRFAPSILIPPDPDQEHGKPEKIIHVENDLRERLARLFARWMPQRQEDFAGRVARRNADFPNPANPPKCTEDVVCAFLPPEAVSTTTWQWFMPDIRGGNFTNAGDLIRNQTLPRSEEENPYFNASVDTLKRIFLRLTLPTTTDLTVPF